MVRSKMSYFGKFLMNTPYQNRQASGYSYQGVIAITTSRIPFKSLKFPDSKPQSTGLNNNIFSHIPTNKKSKNCTNHTKIMNRGD